MFTTVTFSDNQKPKIISSFKKKMGVTIQFLPDQKNYRKYRVLLTKKRQFNKVEKHKKDGKGDIIEFPYNQLKENRNGGLLNGLLESVENDSFSKNIILHIIGKGAPLIKDRIFPMITDWLNKELGKVIKK